MEGIVSDVDLNLFQNDYVYVKLWVEISGTIMWKHLNDKLWLNCIYARPSIDLLMDDLCIGYVHKYKE